MTDSRRSDVIRYYNSREYVDDALRHSLNPYHIAKKLSVLRRYVTEGKVVEIGCGAGVYAGFFPDYVGLDISYEALSRVRSDHNRSVCCDVRAIPLANGCARTVFSFNVLEHVPNPELALEEIDRVLMPGGTVVLKDSWMCERRRRRRISPKSLASLVHSISSRWRMLQRELRGESRLCYKELCPDYTKVGLDHDAVSSIDEYSVFAFFWHRGYEWVNLRKSLLLRMIAPYRNHKRWVIVRKG